MRFNFKTGVQDKHIQRVRGR